jgi:hypothetical protein
VFSFNDIMICVLLRNASPFFGHQRSTTTQVFNRRLFFGDSCPRHKKRNTLINDTLAAETRRSSPLHYNNTLTVSPVQIKPPTVLILPSRHWNYRSSLRISAKLPSVQNNYHHHHHASSSFRPSLRVSASRQVSSSPL